MVVARLLEENVGAEDRCLQEEAKGIAHSPPEDVARCLLEGAAEEDEAYLQGGAAEIVHSHLEEGGAHVGVRACLLEARPCHLENADQIVDHCHLGAKVALFLLEGDAGIIVESHCLLLENDAEVDEKILSLLLEGDAEIGIFHFHQYVVVVADMGVMTVLSLEMTGGVPVGSVVEPVVRMICLSISNKYSTISQKCTI